MRLSAEHAEIIRQTARRHFGQAARVLLFGSRTNDQARGGDIDLLVDTPEAPGNTFRQSLAMETELQMRLGDQKIDILVRYPGDNPSPIHQIALQTGGEL